MAQDDPIKHVVVLMMENHSFDQLLGWTKSIYPGLEGVDETNLRSNPDYPNANVLVKQASSAIPDIACDPCHDTPDVLSQIENNCGGYVANFARAYPQSTPTERAQIMAYYPKGSLPVIHTLAENFMICDHWFSSLPGPTWPNRFFVHSGTCKGHIKMPQGLYIQNEHFYDQNTIYDELDKKGISWSIYHHGMPHTLLFTHLWIRPNNFHRMSGIFDAASGPEEQFPQYVFIEPSYGGTDENDQHPPTDIRKGEYLIAQIYNALRGNENLWNSTLFVLLYDEHGGFYDHVLPPGTVPPDDAVSEYAFNQYGVRVPALLISPWVNRGFLNSVFDHTSLLKVLIEKWGLRPDTLGKRVEASASFLPALKQLTSPRTDTPPAFDLSALALPGPTVPTTTNEHQNALVSFGHFLEQKMATVEELAATGYRSLKGLDGALSQLEVAKDRFLLFLHHGQKGRLKPD
ncbi:MAG TPA: alkaline phosphatase family protein [Candidatus Acidoferrum sp.]|nr:alkaline phosphatase family protein [Candidatus Acidoferrum sp.]